ncbi:mpv17-like protein 2 [Trichoplusia ni]|uniref:Mpv17-like protein 2 n=1 Tax=Trichoplusia ni TaxID=7111 RepID=A0A7E5WAZ1_TRINI|nr:mpv17-like protein 2 [Trichoplusia ni]
MPRLLSKGLNLYKAAITVAFSRKYLFCTNVLISMGISMCGDVLEQTYEIQTKQQASWDFERTSQMAFSGSTAGCLCHHWYIFLDKVIIGRTFDMVIKKLVLDQCICSPIIILSFFATVAIFEDDPIENLTEEVSEKFWTLYKAEWVVWPPAQIINFYLLPTRYRVAYDNTVSLGYDVYTSHVKHAKPKKKENSKE